MAHVELRRLSFRHSGAAGNALIDVDLELDPGLTLLSGPSGSGKSTLLRLLNGLVPHFHGGRIGGSARVCGRDVLTTPTATLARYAGLVFQDPEAQLMGGTVEREVAFGLENLGVAPRLIGDRIEAALAATGSGALRHRAVATLSGGERQRVAIAAVVAMGGEVIGLDEPTSQLDAAGSAAVSAICIDLARRGRTVVIAEHRLEAMVTEADALAVVQDGRVTGPRPVRELAARLGAPPQVIDLGLQAGLCPLPLTSADLPEDIRSRLTRLPPRALSVPRGGVAWRLSSVTAGADRRRPCLESVDAAGCEGEVVAVVGANGSGKSTLLRIIAGLLAPLTGSVERRLGRVALLPQNPTAVLHLPTLRAEVELTLRRAHEPGDAGDTLVALGLAAHAGTHPRDLSTGERQRAALAALLCGRPALALLDEPTRGMDAAARHALVALVRRLRADGTAVVVATHDNTLVAEIADRVVEVREGRTHELGPPRAALSGASPYATQLGALGEGGPVSVEEALALLAGGKPPAGAEDGGRPGLDWRSPVNVAS